MTHAQIEVYQVDVLFRMYAFVFHVDIFVSPVVYPIEVGGRDRPFFLVWSMKIWTGGSDVSQCSSEFVDRIVPDLEDHIAACSAVQTPSAIVDLTNDHEQLVGDSQSVVAAQPFGEFLVDGEAPMPRPFAFSDSAIDGEMFDADFSDSHGEQVDIIGSTSHDTPFPPAMVEPKEESNFGLRKAGSMLELSSQSLIRIFSNSVTIYGRLH